MRKVLISIIALFILTAANAYAHEYKIEFVTTDDLFATHLTDVDINKLKGMVREVYPEAVDAVVDFVGDESAREVLEDVTISIYDHNPEWSGLWGYSIAWRSGPRKKKQNITLIGQPLLNGSKDVKTILTHEMIHAVFETRCSFKEFASQKRYLKEGMAYYGSGDTHPTVIAALNSESQKYDIEEVLKKKWRRRYFMQRTYIYCFEKIYGSEAKQELIRLIYKGKYWESALKKASGDDRAKVYSKCKKCMKEYVKGILDASKSMQDIQRAYDIDDNKYAIYLGERMLEQNPKWDWRFSTHWILGEAYRERYDLEKSTEHFEILKNGRQGLNYLGDDAAYMVILNMVRAGNCDQALKTRQQWDRLYPLFWKKWRDDLEKLFADDCDQEDILMDKGRSHFYHEQYDEAEKIFLEALSVIQNTESPDKKDIEWALTNLGDNCLKKEDYACAENYYKKGVETAKEAWAPDGYRVFDNYHSLAKTYLRQEMYEKEMEVWRQYLEYLRGSTIAKEYRIGRALKGVSDSLRHMERHEEAIQKYREALPVYQANLKKDDLMIAWLQHDMGLSLAALGRYDEAEKAFDEALAVRREKYPSIYPETAKTLLELAKIYKQKDMKKAGEFAHEALSMYKQYPFTDSEDLEIAKKEADGLPAPTPADSATPETVGDNP